MEQRLQKLLAAAGVASRRESEKLISSGRVAVNGQIVTQLGEKADPDTALITVDGKRIELHPPLVYVLLNKPKGYTSTRRDPHAARVVTDLVKDLNVQLYPVGRLDVDSEGLIILTNDGDFAFKVSHPRHHVHKTYRAVVQGLITQDAVDRLANGIMLEDGLTSPARATLTGRDPARMESRVELVLIEGRKRQVRRMLAAVGHQVIHLTRTRIGDIGIGTLKPGEWRFLEPKEIEGLRELAASI